jgi:Na+-transporting methylmalonyl-CoA/oxaloacetate decarboxylase gamma subunit
MSNLQIALTMTVIGMGIVFAGILILWGLMALMVRIWPHDGNEGEAEEEMPSKAETGEAGYLKARAAATAVAVAISLRQGLFNLTTTGAPASAESSWRVTTRALEINQGTQSFNRKPRGSGR